MFQVPRSELSSAPHLTQALAWPTSVFSSRMLCTRLHWKCEAHSFPHTAIHTVPHTAIHTVPHKAIHRVPHTAIHTVPHTAIHTFPHTAIHTVPHTAIHTQKHYTRALQTERQNGRHSQEVREEGGGRRLQNALYLGAELWGAEPSATELSTYALGRPGGGVLWREGGIQRGGGGRRERMIREVLLTNQPTTTSLPSSLPSSLPPSLLPSLHTCRTCSGASGGDDEGGHGGGELRGGGRVGRRGSGTPLTAVGCLSIGSEVGPKGRLALEGGREGGRGGEERERLYYLKH